MYQVDSEDKVVKFDAVPQPSIGAPLPIILSEEGKVILAFYLENPPEGWDGSTVRLTSQQAEEPIAIVELKCCYAHMFGPPNDEVFSSHPLASRGLHPYGAFEVLRSSWIRQCEKMNSIHPYHKPERFLNYHHYVFAFHDSTFECIADGFDVTETHSSMQAILPLMAEKLLAR